MEAFMSEEKNDRNEAEIQENIVPEEKNAEQTDATAENRKNKKGWFKYVFLILCAAVIAGLAGVPQTREMILEKSRRLWLELRPAENPANPAKEQPAEEPQTQEAVLESQEISNRLEQLENAREFENADVVIASVEPVAPPSVASDPAYIALADRQKALLAEIERLRKQTEQFQETTERMLLHFKESIPDTQLFDERIAALHVREDGLERQQINDSLKINRLEKNKADASAVLSLMTRMDAAEQKIRVSNVDRERAVALLLAVYQLREAAFAGNGFETQTQAALALTEDFPRVTEYLKSLSPFAVQGIKTETSLARSFDFYADQAVLSESVSPKTDWFHQAINSLKTLVVIRKTEPDGDDPSTQSVLARAGVAVRDGDLGEAVLISDELKGSAAEAMYPWIRDAKNLLFVKKTINETVSAVLGVVYAEQLKGE